MTSSKKYAMHNEVRSWRPGIRQNLGTVGKLQYDSSNGSRNIYQVLSVWCCRIHCRGEFLRKYSHTFVLTATRMQEVLSKQWVPL